MKRTQVPEQHHELSIGGMAPWPVPAVLTIGDVNANPAARCCKECGRRLLLLLLKSSTWVSQRTEYASFHDDLSVMRRVAIECHVPDQAPVFRGEDGQFYSLVPLSVMRRKALIQFKLRDEDGRSVFVPSLRQNQAITESVLLACADAILNVTSGREVAAFIHQVVSGDQQELTTAYESLARGTAAPTVSSLAGQLVFRAVLDRLADNFVLWVMIPSGVPRRRELTFSYLEPLQPSYRRPSFNNNRYGLGRRLGPWHPIVWCSTLGLMPTRIEFPVPAAESTTSFHFEIDAPKGVRIVEASLLAGRPNQANPSLDHVQGSFPAVGLRVVEVPNGSLSRAQIVLQAVTSGWMMTSMLSSWVIAALLLTFATHYADMTRDSGLPALIFAALAGQVAGLIAQSNAYGLAAYLLKRARVLATIVAFLPLVTVYIALETIPGHVIATLWTAVLIGWVIAIILTYVCLLSWQRQRKIVRSPWEQNRARMDYSRPVNFEIAAKAYHYDKPAMRVDSAEGWTAEFFWDQDTEDQLITTLAMQYSASHLLYSTDGLPQRSG